MFFLGFIKCKVERLYHFSPFPFAFLFDFTSGDGSIGRSVFDCQAFVREKFDPVANFPTSE